ncbi:hypothetical protein SUDANB140_02024 [Streptomyces sp. enrichment culture]
MLIHPDHPDHDERSKVEAVGERIPGYARRVVL